MRQYYINIDSEQKGPFSLEELENLKLTKETPIWHKELDNWTTAGKLDELKELFTSIPPPFTPKQDAPPPFEENQDSPPPFKKSQESASTPIHKSNSNKKRNLIILISVLLIGGVTAIIVVNSTKSSDTRNDSSDSEKSADEIPADEPKEEQINNSPTENSSVKQNNSGNSNYQNNSNYEAPKSEYELKQELLDQERGYPRNYLSMSFTWKVNIALNTIIEGTIYNSATMAQFKNITIWVGFYSKTDVLLGQDEFTVMEFIDAGGSLTFRHKISGFWENASNAKYEIISAENSY